MKNAHGKIVGLFGGCHHAPGFVGTSIVVFTTWPWRWFRKKKVSTHSSVGVIYEDGYRELYEAREGKSWQGPIPVSKVEEWVARKPKQRRFTMYDIPADMISADAMNRKRAMCERFLKIWDYSIMQLPRMGVRKYLPFLPINHTPNEVVCSEAATIILSPEVPILRVAGKRTPDLVNPYDFEQALKRICIEPRHEVADVSDAYSG